MILTRDRAPGLAARVVGAFAGVILAFAAAAAFSVRGERLALLRLDEVRREDEAARTALRLATAVRELYVHQAETILTGDSQHLSFYAEALAEVARQVEAARASPVLSRDQAAVERISTSVERLDHVFRDQIVPAMQANDWAKVRSEHVRSEEDVSAIVAAVDGLQQRVADEVAVLRARAEAEVARAQAVTVALFAFAVAVAAALAVYVFRSVVRPLRTLIEGAQRIGGGDLKTRLEVRSRDEVGRLAESFNAMASALAEHEARLVSAEKLAALGRLSAGVAHELNNPLGVASGYVKLLRKQAPEALQGDLDIVSGELRRAHEIVQEMLGLARDTRERPLEPVDLAEIAREAIRLQQAVPDPDVPRAPIHVGDLPALPARGDRDRLLRVVSNLLRNAAQAAGEQGEVRVSGRAAGADVELTVEDTGGGISQEARARLFEPFFSTKPKGTGLGLAVSLAIARSHDGTLLADDRPGGGARFTLRIPKAKEVGT